MSGCRYRSPSLRLRGEDRGHVKRPAFTIPNDIQARTRTGAALGCRIRIKRRRGSLMTRAYNVVDADGHILEPLDLWDKYIEPKFRDRAPRIVKDNESGKERLVIEEHTVGNAQLGIGRIGAVGARQGVVAADTMEYKEGRAGGVEPPARLPHID